MFKKIYDFILNHGMLVMVIGFVMAIVSLLVYMKTRYYGSAIPRVAFGFTIAGFVVYLLGRIFVAVGQRRRPHSSKNTPNAWPEDDS